MAAPEQPTDAAGLAKRWYERTSVVAVGHYKAAAYLTGWNGKFTGCSAILSGIVGTAAFATLQAQPATWLQIGAGILSVAAAVLATFAGTMGYQEKAEKHRLAAAKYNAIGRRLEQVRAAPEIDAVELAAVRVRLDELSLEMPHIPKHIHNQMGSFEDIDQWGDKQR